MNSVKIRDHFDDILESSDFYRKHVLQGKDSLFRSVADVLLLSQRNSVVVKDLFDRFCSTIEGTRLFDPALDLDHKEVRAIVSIFNVTVEIISATDPNLTPIVFTPKNVNEPTLKCLASMSSSLAALEDDSLSDSSVDSAVEMVHQGKPAHPPEAYEKSRILLCYTQPVQYDPIFRMETIEAAGIAQSIIYEALYERIFKMKDAYEVADLMLSGSLSVTPVYSFYNEESSARAAINKGKAPFPFKVAKALDPTTYRNIELDIFKSTPSNQAKPNLWRSISRREDIEDERSTQYPFPQGSSPQDSVNIIDQLKAFDFSVPPPAFFQKCPKNDCKVIQAASNFEQSCFVNNQQPCQALETPSSVLYFQTTCSDTCVPPTIWSGCNCQQCCQRKGVSTYPTNLQASTVMPELPSQGTGFVYNPVIPNCLQSPSAVTILNPDGAQASVGYFYSYPQGTFLGREQYNQATNSPPNQSPMLLSVPHQMCMVPTQMQYPPVHQSFVQADMRGYISHSGHQSQGLQYPSYLGQYPTIQQVLYPQHGSMQSPGFALPQPNMAHGFQQMQYVPCPPLEASVPQQVYLQSMDSSYSQSLFAGNGFNNLPQGQTYCVLSDSHLPTIHMSSPVNVGMAAPQVLHSSALENCF